MGPKSYYHHQVFIDGHLDYAGYDGVLASSVIIEAGARKAGRIVHVIQGEASGANIVLGGEEWADIDVQDDQQSLVNHLMM